ncbi:MAG: hypothetical protein JWP91_2484 [Fibrobacteres bacterium]|nr:hypothetical protein [Fibrobacterota bacterium]
MRRFLSTCALGAFAAFAMLSAPAEVQARQGGNFGAGFIAGDPSGLSGKLWLSDVNALDFIAGFSIRNDNYDRNNRNDRNDWLSLNVDYVWHEFGLIQVSQGQMPLYYGMGVWTLIPYAALGVRGVVGIEYLFPSAPLDVFLEIGPGASILPATGVGLSGGLGMRYYF